MSHRRSGSRGPQRTGALCSPVLGVLLLMVMLMIMEAMALKPVAAGAPIPVVSDSAADALQPQTADDWTLAAAAPSLFRGPREAPRLHVGVMSVPLWGHFKLAWAIAEELAFRGHGITVFVEEASWCRAILAHSRHPAPLVLPNMSAATPTNHTTADGHGDLDVRCVLVPQHREVFSSETFRPITQSGSSVTFSIVRLFHDLFEHHALSLGDSLSAAQAVHARQPLTTMLCDIVSYACTSTARRMELPVVHTFPFTTQLAIGVHPLLPAVGLGLPRRMTLAQQTINAAFKLLSLATAGPIVAQLNRVRAAHGVVPLRDAYEVAGMRDPLITASLWGLDIPQPLCPNVHPVGPLNTRDQRQPYHRRDLSPDLADFMDGCAQGVVYVNWGTLSAPSAGMEATLMEGLEAAAPYCVVWKRRTRSSSNAALPDRFFVTTWLSSPMAVLKHPNTFAFVSHCGDASVLEAVEAAVPIIGFPLFADQADVCQRIEESGIGVQVTQTKTFVALDVLRAVANIADARNQMKERLRDLRSIAESYGGAAAAADIVEARQFNLLLSSTAEMEQCSGLDSTFRPMAMLTVWAVVLLLASLAWCLVFRVLGRAASAALRQLRSHRGDAHRETQMSRTAPQKTHARAVPRPYKGYKEL